MSEIVPKTLILRCDTQSFYRDRVWMSKNAALPNPIFVSRPRAPDKKYCAAKTGIFTETLH